LPEQSEAERVRKEAAKEQQAAERRAAEQDKVLGRASVPEGSDAPSEIGGAKGADLKIARERLIDNAAAYLRQPPFVVAGALHGDKRAYLTLDQAREAVEQFLSREVA
jgi:hypothetical protein